jgi:hypothetical protein
VTLGLTGACGKLQRDVLAVAGLDRNRRPQRDRIYGDGRHRISRSDDGVRRGWHVDLISIER